VWFFDFAQDQLPAKGLKESDEEKLFLPCIERSAFGA
jgi:hypothetical protein